MSIVESVKNIVRESMIASTTHDWEHIERVYILATKIAEKEEADLELVQLGALLHDIGRIVREPHNVTGKAKAREILEGLSYDSKRIDLIENIIENHNLGNWHKLGSMEEKIVWDADKLDGIGAIGVARAFFMGGETGLPFHDFTWFEDDTMLRYSRLNTSAAKEIGKERIEYMSRFFERLNKEIQP